MRHLRLTEAEKTALYEKLESVRDMSGDFEVIVEAERHNIIATGSMWLDGYTEADTDAWIETNREVSVSITAYDEGGEPYEVDATEFYNYLLD